MAVDAREIGDIRERLARIETRQENHGKTIEDGFSELGKRFDKFDERLRMQEVKAAGYGTIAGGVISVGIAYISSKIKGAA